jgi:hypothetical protein
MFGIVAPIGAQTTLMTSQQWQSLFNGLRPAPFKPPKFSPYRQITKSGSYEDGDLKGGYMGYITFEQYSNENARFHRVERVGTTIRSEEKLRIGKSMFTRLDNGRWVANDIPSQTKVVRVPDDPVNSPYFRKPGAEEILYYSLGERRYKGQMVSVYEEVTRHVLVRKADNSEIHYENRTRFWVSQNNETVRYDTYYAIFDSDRTSRMFTSNEWEVDLNIKPFEIPIK